MVSTSAQPGFSIANWKPFAKNTLVGFFSVTLPSGMVLHECAYHRKGEARWIGLPVRKYEKGGEVGYAPLVEFVSKEAKQRFQERALAAVDRFLAGGAQ